MLEGKHKVMDDQLTCCCLVVLLLFYDCLVVEETVNWKMIVEGLCLVREMTSREEPDSRSGRIS